MALRSTAQKAFCIVNTYFSSLGFRFRSVQYTALNQYSRNHPHHSFLLAGDQNRSDHSKSKWYFSTADREVFWGEHSPRESDIFHRSVLNPLQLHRVATNHLGFRHRSGKYAAEIDSFFLPSSTLSDALCEINFTPTPLGTGGASDHDPIRLDIRMRACSIGKVADWVFHHKEFPNRFAAHMNLLSQ